MLSGCGTGKRFSYPVHQKLSRPKISNDIERPGQTTQAQCQWALFESHFLVFLLTKFKAALWMWKKHLCASANAGKQTQLCSGSKALLHNIKSFTDDSHACELLSCMWASLKKEIDKEICWTNIKAASAAILRNVRTALEKLRSIRRGCVSLRATLRHVWDIFKKTLKMNMWWNVDRQIWGVARNHLFCKRCLCLWPCFSFRATPRHLGFWQRIHFYKIKCFAANFRYLTSLWGMRINGYLQNKRQYGYLVVRRKLRSSRVF